MSSNPSTVCKTDAVSHLLLLKFRVFEENKNVKKRLEMPLNFWYTLHGEY